MFVLGEGVLEPEKQFLAASPFSSVSLGGRGWYRWVGLAPCSARQARLLGAPQGWVVPSGASQVDPPSSGTVAGRLPSGAQLTPCGRARRKCPSGSESPASRLPDSDREVIKSFHVSYQVSGGPAVFLVVRQSADARGSRGPDLPASSALTPACPRWQKPRPALSTGSSSPGRDVVRARGGRGGPVSQFPVAGRRRSSVHRALWAPRVAQALTVALRAASGRAGRAGGGRQALPQPAASGLSVALCRSRSAPTLLTAPNWSPRWDFASRRGVRALGRDAVPGKHSGDGGVTAQSPWRCPASSSDPPCVPCSNLVVV